MLLDYAIFLLLAVSNTLDGETQYLLTVIVKTQAYYPMSSGNFITLGEYYTRGVVKVISWI